MANITWIKMKVGMFDGISFKRIKRAKIGGKLSRDKLTAIWFELMDFAGKCNDNGTMSDIDDLSIMIDRDVKELKPCLDYFISEKMIEVSSDGTYSIVNWSTYQNTEEMSKIKEQNRLRKQKQRDKQKNTTDVSTNVSTDVSQETERDCHGDVTVMSRDCHGTEEEREKEREEEKEIEYSFIHSFSCDENEFCDNVTENVTGQNDSFQRNLNKGDLFGGVVMLSDAQFEDLCEKLSLDELNHYIGIVRDCELKGKSYKKKTHYQAIMEMVNKDRKLS